MAPVALQRRLCCIRPILGNVFAGAVLGRTPFLIIFTYTMALCLETEQLETVQRILSLHFDGLEVWAYGPRLTGVDLTPETELDLAVIAERPLSFEAMTAVEKAFAESGLSFRVDVVDWVKLPETMQKQIKKEHEVVQTVAED